jgi:hypothetical protein
MPIIMIVLAIVVVLVSLSLRVVKEYDRGALGAIVGCSQSEQSGASKSSPVAEPTL